GDDDRAPQGAGRAAGPEAPAGAGQRPSREVGCRGARPGARAVDGRAAASGQAANRGHAAVRRRHVLSTDRRDHRLLRGCSSPERARRPGRGAKGVGAMNTAMREELLRRAQEEGLVDVAYTTLDGPLGTLLLATTDRGLVRVAFANETEDEVL